MIDFGDLSGRDPYPIGQPEEGDSRWCSRETDEGELRSPEVDVSDAVSSVRWLRESTDRDSGSRASGARHESALTGVQRLTATARLGFGRRTTKRRYQMVAASVVIGTVVVSVGGVLSTSSERKAIAEDASTIRSLCGAVNYDLALDRTSTNLAFAFCYRLEEWARSNGVSRLEEIPDEVVSALGSTAP